MSALSLENKVVLVVGAGGSQGGAFAKLAVREGARVVASDVSVESLAELQDEVAVHGECVTRTLDVSNEADWREVVQEAQSTFGRIDGLANFAAIYSRSGLEDATVADWDAVIRVNLTGAWLGMRAVMPVMRGGGGGSIVNIGTMDALIGRGTAVAYQASKGGLRMMTKNAATLYAPVGIRVNIVHPGAMEDRVKTILGSPASEDDVKLLMESLREKTPLGRFGTAQDIAWAVRYLLSDESAFVTGVDLPVDGGYTVQ